MPKFFDLRIYEFISAERLDVGYVREADERKLHLYCNILHTTKNITFCRFQQTTQASGFNVMDGLSDGRYRWVALLIILLFELRHGL